MKNDGQKTVRLPSIVEAFLPIITMVCLMVYVFNFSDGGYNAAHMPLVIAICVACIVGGICGHSFSDMLEGIIERLTATLEAILILLTVGLLISSFMISGTIPAVIYYGLKLLTPQLFLPVGCMLIAVVSLACGSSWTATGTIGIAFMTIGVGLGISPALTAGMVISGAYVGDKFSPLSDTTNLASGVSGTGLFDHVTAMVSTTGPVFIISLILYTILGSRIDVVNYDPSIAQGIEDSLAANFNLNPLVLLPIAVIVAVCILRVPGLPGVIISVVTGVLFAVIFQGHHNVAEIFSVLHYGPSVETGNEFVDKALAKGGMDHQMWTVNLILLAVSFGGALEKCGSVERIFGNVKHKIHTVGGLVFATMLTSIFCDAAMCDQFLGIGVPAPLYDNKYDELGLARNMLSRTLEDAGTLWACMFPWTACGAYQSGILGMNPFVYFPFAFVNLLNPIYACLTAFMGRNIFWADGAYTNVFGKTTMRKAAKAPEEAHKYALAQLEKLRAEGKAPKVNA
ncbi:MAG: Na+/H+ antiporter NhaC [Peptoniphilus harei]|uniref:Na+/H+ antiporter NhaC n=1 Tax=Peptoniphilus harei TaxID=54005 RepID=UPI00254A7A60|nr:Na+/H+ antiporter NhaC [Peptoniphilus harei]MDK7755833.1 Na+/H+ antiporter NhaC [Peptoniphilus harei]MDK7761375.1 Na+/H+ antiporter NhaC [Peptoniphilus harei]MDK8271196.1 Na+/H+ antiporter NhaC [Peptoniphilus harei]MDK8339666.1 Na+/H+ antiporter NhaC [Peptoniphilus harei]